ncbi:MAG: 30S ribosomal protein S17 [SAR202 cluster bacterium Casp-Chloro-G4]|nr:MAG: 30S ribosomal protein S17 [SAR202 cluster bacterium Casp-Chloro-G4]
MSFERRKVRIGRVVSDKMDGTCVVIVEWRKSHRLYKKSVKMRTRFNVHDPLNVCKLGDQVRIMETRPISKTKRWRVSEILQSEEIAEIQPEEIRVEDESVLMYQPQHPAADEIAAVVEADVVAEAETVVEDNVAVEVPVEDAVEEEASSENNEDGSDDEEKE